MTKLKALIVAILVAVPMQLSAQANDSSGSSTKQNRDMSGAKSPGSESTSQPTQAQKQFEEATLAKLHLINQHEIEAGNLAEQRGQSADVRSYGKTLAKDHQQLDQSVKELAESQNITLPDPQQDMSGSNAKMQAELKKMQEQQQAHAQRLQNTPDDQFDREFLKAMANGHQQAVQMVTAAQGQAKDAQFKSLLSDTLPVIKQHLQIAKQLQSQVKSGTPKSSNTPSKNE
jgi:putative membrane protein